MNMKLQVALIFSLALLTISLTEVDEESLRSFWEAAYDPDGDGKASLHDFIKFFRVMEPQRNIGETDIAPIFALFDMNSDRTVTMNELAQFGKLKVGARVGPKQVHIGLTNNDGEMQVMWVTTREHLNKPVVYYGKVPGFLNQKVEGTWTTYNVGHIGFKGRIYRAVMTNLQPLQNYFYKVGDAIAGQFSEVHRFKSPPLKVQSLDQIRIAVCGDMGTFAPMGGVVINQIVRDNLFRPLDLVFLTGDISYAGMNSQQKGEIQPIWDFYGQLTQSFAAYVPFMPGVGNHEKYYNYSAYTHRYYLPRHSQSSTNLWFSFDYAQVHFIHFSSEHPYALGSEQFTYLEEDLNAARGNPNIHWIIVGVHRPVYCSSTYEHQNVTNLARELEELFNKYKVDIVQTGHAHCYERSWPLYKGKAMKKDYINPQHPVYVVQGTSGALIKEKWSKPTPEWSVKRMQRYGYGRITIKGVEELKYQFVQAPTGMVIDEWKIVRKQPKKNIL